MHHQNEFLLVQLSRIRIGYHDVPQSPQRHSIQPGSFEEGDGPVDVHVSFVRLGSVVGIRTIIDLGDAVSREGIPIRVALVRRHLVRVLGIIGEGHQHAGGTTAGTAQPARPPLLLLLLLLLSSRARGILGRSQRALEGAFGRCGSPQWINVVVSSSSMSFPRRNCGAPAPTMTADPGMPIRTADIIARAVPPGLQVRRRAPPPPRVVPSRAAALAISRERSIQTVTATVVLPRERDRRSANSRKVRGSNHDVPPDPQSLVLRRDPVLKKLYQSDGVSELIGSHGGRRPCIRRMRLRGQDAHVPYHAQSIGGYAGGEEEACRLRGREDFEVGGGVYITRAVSEQRVVVAPLVIQWLVSEFELW
mmetsp:Transcript_39717/g.95536  ORF Transcript_39717/g.95536 Transcript_39717/m.95536 type:complete len:363 (-) Transcript_39717:363-1451(-)